MTSNILHHLNELKRDWKDQNFSFTKEQQSAYNILIDARRERVKSFYAEGRVSKGKKSDDD